MIILKNTTDHDVALEDVRQSFENSTYVDMHFKGKSTKGPLFSDNYANCLGVIVHDSDNHRGYLMHIFPALAGGINVHSLFHFADEQIEQALNEFKGSEHIELMLFKGLSYTPAGLRALPMTYADYAKTRFGDRVHTVIDMMDSKSISQSSKMLYLPETGEAYMVSPVHNEYFDGSSLKTKSEMELETWSMEKADDMAEVDNEVAQSINRMAAILGEEKPYDEDKFKTTTSQIMTSLSQPEELYIDEDDFGEFVGVNSPDVSVPNYNEDHSLFAPFLAENTVKADEQSQTKTNDNQSPKGKQHK